MLSVDPSAVSVEEESDVPGAASTVPRLQRLKTSLHGFTAELTRDDVQGQIMSAEEMFKLADEDKSGHISMDEFRHLHTAIAHAAVKQDRKRRHLERRTRLAMKVAMVVGLLLLFTLAANACLTYVVVYMSKDTEVVNGKLVDLMGNTLKTSSADTQVSENGVLLSGVGRPIGPIAFRDVSIEIAVIQSR